MINVHTPKYWLTASSLQAGDGQGWCIVVVHWDSCCQITAIVSLLILTITNPVCHQPDLMDGQDNPGSASYLAALYKELKAKRKVWLLEKSAMEMQFLCKDLVLVTYHLRFWVSVSFVHFSWLVYRYAVIKVQT